MTAVHTIKLKRNTEAGLPTLDTGEPGWATDTGKLYVGNSGSNTLVGGNSFTNIVPSSGTTVVADSTSDTLTISGTGGITVTGTAGTDTIVIDGSGITGYSDEQAQDAIGIILVDSSEIDFTYSDATPSITASLLTTTVTAASYGSATQVPTYTVDSKGRLTAASNTTIAIPSTAVTDFNEAAQDAVGGILTDSATIDFTYNDGAGTITASVITTDFFGFKTIDCPSGTDPVADQLADTLALTSNGSITITGTSGTDTIDFSLNMANPNTWTADQTFQGDVILGTGDEILFGDGTSGCSNGGFDGALVFFSVGNMDFSSTSGSARFGQKLIPTTDASFDLGAIGGFLDNRWNNLYLAGSAFLRTNSSKYRCGSSNQASFGYDGTDAFINPKESGSGVLKILGDISLIDEDVILGTTTGSKLGTSTSQKLSLWNATPIVQPTTAVAAATFVANTSAIADDTATFDGYTIGQVVKALRNMGALA